MNKYEKQYILAVTDLDEIFSKYVFKMNFQESVLDLTKLFNKFDKLEVYFDVLLDNITDEGIQFIIRELNESINEIQSYIETLSSKNNDVTIKRDEIVSFYNYKETLVRHKTRIERLI